MGSLEWREIRISTERPRRRMVGHGEISLEVRGSPIKASKLAEQYMHEFRRMFSYDDVPTYPYPPQPPTNPPDDGDDDEDHVDLKEAFEEYGKDFFKKRGVSSRFWMRL
jgi:hypothetical protein